MTNGSWILGDRKIDRLGFGAMRLPLAADFDAALGVLRRAVELGADHVDTAAFYHQQGIAANDLIREAAFGPDVVVATKVGPYRGPDDPFPTGQLPADELRREVERNLRELGRDRLDLVYLRPGGLEPADDHSVAERFEILAELRGEGVIRHLGLSHVTLAQVEEARRIAPVVAIQNRFDISQPADTAMLAVCERDGIAYVPYFPLGGFGLPDDPRVAAVAARHGASVPQVLLAGLLALSPVALAIPGTSSRAHLEENMGAAALRLTEADVAELTGPAD
ncbi:aldo/keto reductase [Actinomadura atramentaria]|uniref:aldo/keto reductase n=1 Tax=Actinomadura atramentaria TaxID=1990 RepID=UPI00037270DA|nr:aldo/keto reductase [Actinomadura atramentaria]